MTKRKHFNYWLKKYLLTILFPRLGTKKGFRRDWMTWAQYKDMTNNLTKELVVHNK